MGNNYTEKNQMYVSVDCIIFGYDEGRLKLLLGKRQLTPGYGEWALYGGFVAKDEALDEAAARVLTELTGLDGVYMRQAGAYGTIGRDPMARVVSVAYSALINVRDYDESLLKEYNAVWVPVEDVPPLFSDHGAMVQEALRRLRISLKSEPACFTVLPQLFTLTQLQHVFEAILGHELDKRNFRKRVKQCGILLMTDKKDKITSKRGAALYRLNPLVEYHF